MQGEQSGIQGGPKVQAAEFLLNNDAIKYLKYRPYSYWWGSYIQKLYNIYTMFINIYNEGTQLTA